MFLVALGILTLSPSISWQQTTWHPSLLVSVSPKAKSSMSFSSSVGSISSSRRSNWSSSSIITWHVEHASEPGCTHTHTHTHTRARAQREREEGDGLVRGGGDVEERALWFHPDREREGERERERETWGEQNSPSQAPSSSMSFM